MNVFQCHKIKVKLKGQQITPFNVTRQWQRKSNDKANTNQTRAPVTKCWRKKGHLNSQDSGAPLWQVNFS